MAHDNAVGRVEHRLGARPRSAARSAKLRVVARKQGGRASWQRRARRRARRQRTSPGRPIVSFSLLP